jgi:hypothetical protein
MRRRASLLLVTVACATASAAYAGGPGDVYTDFAQDGKLSCNHSRDDLEAALRSGTLNQYGDPLTLARMKLAVRKQLAGSGCGKRGSSTPATGGATTTGSTTTTETGRTGSREHSKSKPGHGQRTAAPQPSVQRGRPASEDNGSFLAGRGLAIGLLAGAVAFGGWLTKHALSARR